MGTYTQILYQIVFGTKNRRRTLTLPNRIRLFQYMTGILKSKNCHVYRINGVEDHLHIITHLHPAIALADLVKDIKLASSAFIKEEKLFRNFEGWQRGYSAFTYSPEAKHNLIRYVKNQEAHHRARTYKEELIDLLVENEVDFDRRYLD